MDASVVGALITSGVALVVAVGGGIRNDLRAATERRYERRRAFLVDAQDAALLLRDALRAYGTAVQEQARAGGGRQGSFTLGVPDHVAAALAAAQGRLAVTMSRLEDPAVVATLRSWQAVAQVSLIDPLDEEASAEQQAFDLANAAVGEALQSTSGAVDRSGRRRLPPGR